MPSDRDVVSDNRLESFLSETVNDATIYLNLGLTLAAAISWAEAGKHVVSKLKTPQGPLYNAIFMTIVAAVIFRVTSNRSKKRY